MDANYKWNTRDEFDQQIKLMSGNYECLGKYFAACCAEMGTSPEEVLINLMCLNELDEEDADIRTGNVEVRVDDMRVASRESLIRVPDDSDEPDELD